MPDGDHFFCFPRHAPIQSAASFAFFFAYDHARANGIAVFASPGAFHICVLLRGHVTIQTLRLDETVKSLA